MNVQQNVEEVIRSAEARRSRVVFLKWLLAFSTEDGDAWLLEAHEQLAVQLAEGGQRLGFQIYETQAKLLVGWEYTWEMQGDAFVVTRGSTRRAILGYPIDKIRAAILRGPKPISAAW